MHYPYKFFKTAIRLSSYLLLLLGSGVAVISDAQDAHDSHKNHAAHGNNAAPEQHEQQAEPNALLQTAKQIHNQAGALEKQAGTLIQNANKIRKRVKQLRAQQRDITDEETRALQKSMTDELAAQLELYQTTSGEVRKSASEVREAANQLFKEGFQQQWADWISNTGELQIASGEHESMAHNNQVRSAHSNMEKLLPDTSEMPEKHEGMSMRVPAMTSQPSIEDLNTSTFQISRDSNYIAHIEVEPASDNKAQSVPLNEIHRWRLILSDLDGVAVEHADIEIVGHMPGHVHGLPTQPRVTEEISPGVYRVEGLKFQMQGWWVMEFNIGDDAGDTVKFDILL